MECQHLQKAARGLVAVEGVEGHTLNQTVASFARALSFLLLHTHRPPSPPSDMTPHCKTCKGAGGADGKSRDNDSPPACLSVVAARCGWCRFAACRGKGREGRCGVWVVNAGARDVVDGE